MAVILSGAAGGIIPIWVISWLVGKIPPLTSLSRPLNILYSGLAAYAVTVALAGFGAADGGPWDPGYMWIAYLVSLVIVVVLRTTFAAMRERRKVEG
jgi:hypothetical protein